MGLPTSFCCWCWWLRPAFATNAPAYDRCLLLILREMSCIWCDLGTNTRATACRFAFSHGGVPRYWKSFHSRIIHNGVVTCLDESIVQIKVAERDIFPQQYINFSIICVRFLDIDHAIFVLFDYFCLQLCFLFFFIISSSTFFSPSKFD
jgi:hypothetical protein